MSPQLARDAVITSRGVLLALIISAACTPDARRALLETALDAAQCALAHQDLPDAQIITTCGIKAIDVDRIMRIVGESRKAAARAGACK